MAQIWLFPGQGSQQLGMGRELFAQFPRETAIAETILGYSVEDLCLQDPHHCLDQTQYTQPALYVVNALTALQQQRAGSPTPDFLAGHSLGEYNALLVAGAFDFATGLRMVQQRGALMAEASGGGMLAVVGLAREQIAEFLQAQGFTDIDLANLNAPEQTVVSGPKARIDQAKPLLEQAGARVCVTLKVSAAFHSRYMRPAADRYAAFLEGFTIQDPRIPVVANVTGRPYGTGEVKQLLAAQIVSPVQWRASVEFLLDQPDPQFQEVGPGKVLAGLLARIRRARASA